MHQAPRRPTRRDTGTQPGPARAARPRASELNGGPAEAEGRHDRDEGFGAKLIWDGRMLRRAQAASASASGLVSLPVGGTVGPLVCMLLVGPVFIGTVASGSPRPP
jgi:hypothetical protein